MKSEIDIYKEDCQFLRYQNDLMWNRFKTASTIEGFVLLGLYQLSKELDKIEIRLLMIFGFLLVLSVLLISLRDSYIQKKYLKRIKEFEKNNEIEFLDKYPKLLRGNKLMIVVISLITLMNISILCLNW